MTIRSVRTSMLVAVAALLTASLALAPAASGQHDHEHEAHGAAGLTLNDGARWATDAPLRTGMEHIRDAVAPALGTWPTAPTQADATRLAAAVRDQVSYVVANCKLEPRADATLHVIIGELLGGAEALERDPKSADGLPRIEHALRQYPEYFEHAGWKPAPAHH